MMMTSTTDRRSVLLGLLAAGGISSASAQQTAAKPDKRLLYVASPGIRNYEEHGGTGLLVFDIDQGYKFVKRIPTWSVPSGEKPENVKGIAASANTGKVYITSLHHLLALDGVTGKRLWDKTYEGGCDRLAISPDGKTIYLPQLEGPLWHVVDASNGSVISKIELNSGSHNTIYAPDGSRVYLAGLKSKDLSIADPKTHKVIAKVGPFANVIRPFTVNGANTLCFVNINALLGFEVGEMQTGRKLYRVEVKGYEQGPVKRHGCPSHGIALTPDERELWVVDGHNNAIHVFDMAGMPPRQITSIKVRDSPGWMSFSLDGRFGYCSTGEIVDVASKKIVAALKDETGRDVQSEKIVEVAMSKGKIVRVGDQFGIGRKTT